MKTITLPNGKTYEFAPLGLTKQACDFLELFEDRGNCGVSKFVRALREILMQSLSKKYSPDDIEEALASIPIGGETSNKLLDQVVEALVDAG